MNDMYTPKIDSNQQARANSQPRVAPIVLQQLPNMPTLLGRAAFKSGNYRLGDALPPLSTEIKHLVIRLDHLHAYREICGFTLSNRLPATYLHMLSFPLSLNLLIQQDFPMKAMGQVHLRNQISVLEEFDTSLPISMKATIGGSELTSRGLEWDIDVTASVDNQLVWSSTSTYLNRCKTNVPSVRQRDNKLQGETSQWRVPADIGRRYAKVSADYNPIHLSDMTAKLFGFKQAIAHGMWSKARCLAAIEDQLPAAGYSVDVAFQKPLFLPAEVLFTYAKTAQDEKFTLNNSKSGVSHLIGQISRS